MKFYMTGQEKCDFLIQVTAEVTAWAGLTVFKNILSQITKERRSPVTVPVR